MSDLPDLTGFYTHINQRLQAEDTSAVRLSAIHLVATMSSLGRGDTLREKIIDGCLAAGLLTTPAEAFSIDLGLTIHEVLDGQ